MGEYSRDIEYTVSYEMDNIMISVGLLTLMNLPDGQ
jgi:hypothetical protein